MTYAKTPPIHVLRGILRHIRSAPKQEMPRSASSTTTDAVSNSNRNPLIAHVMCQYRESQSVPAESRQAKLLRKMAYDFWVLKEDLAERGRLHELDGGAEVKLSPKELTRRAAARAGLQPPEVHQDHS